MYTVISGIFIVGLITIILLLGTVLGFIISLFNNPRKRRNRYRKF